MLLVRVPIVLGLLFIVNDDRLYMSLELGYDMVELLPILFELFA